MPAPLLDAFMDNGGGVFATGDHEDLGAGMCGQVTRVRSMRNWFTGGVPVGQQAPSGSGTQRLDTNVPNPLTGNDFDNQSDRYPQRIYPTWYDDGSIFRSVPHPLLAGPGRVVTHLPDHAHEGRCVVPAVLDPAEYPGGFGPEIVARAVSAGAAFDHGTAKVAVEPRLFGVIGAYDGRRRASRGRLDVAPLAQHQPDRDRERQPGRRVDADRPAGCRRR